MSVSKVYRGRIVITGNGEEDELIGLFDAARSDTEILADTLQDDMHQHGRYLSVRYVVSDAPIEPDKIDEAIVRHLLGRSEIKYGMRYSEITGYLWTDEEINVGGHDLLNELRTHLDKMLHLEIIYSKAPA